MCNLRGLLALRCFYRILVLFEPRSGAFSWNSFTDYPSANEPWQELAFKKSRAAFLKNGRLVTFSAGGGPDPLYVQDSEGHASSLDDAEAEALGAAAKLNDPPGRLDALEPSHIVPLASVPGEFVIPPMDAGVGQTPKVVNVQWHGNQWIVLLEARWKESITLDASFNLVSVRKVE